MTDGRKRMRVDKMEKLMKIDQIDGNGWSWMKMDQNWWKRVKLDEIGKEWMKIDKNWRKWIDVDDLDEIGWK